MLQSKVFGCFNTWLEMSRSMRENITKMKGTMVRMLKRGLAMAWYTMLETARESKRKKMLMRNTLKKLRNTALHNGLAVWRDACRAGRDKIASLRKVLPNPACLRLELTRQTASLVLTVTSILILIVINPIFQLSRRRGRDPDPDPNLLTLALAMTLTLAALVLTLVLTLSRLS